MKDNKYKKLLFIVWIILCALLGFNLVKIPQVKNFILQNFSVKEVIVEGAENLDKEKIKNIFANKIWFNIDEKEVSEEFKRAFPFVKSIKIDKLDYRVVKVKVEKYKPFAYLTINKKRFLITKDGVKLDEKYFPNLDKTKLLNIVVNDIELDREKLKKLEKLNKFCQKFNLEKYIIYRNQIACVLKGRQTFVFDLDNLEKNIKKANRFFSKVKDIEEYTLLNFSFKDMVLVKEKKKEIKEDGKE